MSLLPPLLHRTRFRPNAVVSLFLFFVCVAVMAWIRLYVFGDRTVSLSYGLPLMICVWYPDRRLLWGLSGTFAAIAGWKSYVMLPAQGLAVEPLAWPIQLVNILIIAAGIHLIIDLVDALFAQKAKLEEANRELVAREGEIRRQNKELQTQTGEVRQQAGELHARTEELQVLNAGLDRLVKERTAELQEMVNELEHFSYTITHDLRAPLRAMHGFSELLAEECRPLLNAAGLDYLRRIATSATRMDRLITDALSFSKVMRHEMPMTPQDPAALLAGMIDSYPGFQEPRARIRIAGPLPRVLANEAGLTQCFSNLLGNAVKFVEKGRTPQVTIHAEQNGSFVRLWFEDNGIGIAPGMHARVFGMFQRLCKDYEGTGIGLALVKKVVERMGGGVGLESEPGLGSRFWIELKAA